MTDAGARRPAAWTLAVWWLVIVVAVVGLGWLLTHPLESTVDPWDDDVSRWFAAHRSGDLDALATAGSTPGDTWVGVALALLVAAGGSQWQRSWRPAIFVTVLMSGVYAIYLVATHLVPRDRPPVRILDPGLVPDHSFPSGHVATALALYGGTALLLAWAAPRTRRWARLLLLLPLCVAVARLYQGAHHPTDVLASLLFTTAWLGGVAWVLLPGRSGSGRPSTAA
ncbi:phosphatase PAP2 family protein [Nocardioides sp. LHG3406-4]|uniref:phosphatase PAP2 family protein n=1 Tax=Nocardioides sp. LHG3406-4 TaxID=2804575 RepID=UPI003CEC6F9F